MKVILTTLHKSSAQQENKHYNGRVKTLHIVGYVSEIIIDFVVAEFALTRFNFIIKLKHTCHRLITIKLCLYFQYNTQYVIVVK